MFVRAQPLSSKRGADLLADTLRAAGVRCIFSLSGNQIMPVYDACLSAGIEIVHTRHEASAVFMAEAWAQLTGSIGVALVTAGPGAMNAMGALYSARCSQSPILLLTGDSPIGQDGRGAFQEVDQMATTSPLTKLSLRPHSTGELARDLASAIRIALDGIPGPVHVALAADILQAEAKIAPISDTSERVAPVRAAGQSEVAAVTQALARSERPIVICGPSLSKTRAGGLMEGLESALDVPVLCMESPRGIKDPVLGDVASVLAAADLVVCIAKPVDFTLGFGRATNPDCRWIVANGGGAEQERAQLNLGTRLMPGGGADPAVFARQLADERPSPSHREDWRARVGRAIARRGFKAETAATSAITPLALCAAVQRQVETIDETVIICDGGEFGQWAQATISGTRRIINGPSGAIGGGLAYAIAASKARPDATVFLLTGDGSIGFHLAEFETAAREGVRFVAIVGNDCRWNAEHQIQLRDYGASRLMGCTLSMARYDIVVQALGGYGEHVVDIGDLDGALSRAIDSSGPACVNVMIEGQPAPVVADHH